MLPRLPSCKPTLNRRNRHEEEKYAAKGNGGEKAERWGK
jgi:hypothetical protein